MPGLCEHRLKVSERELKIKNQPEGHVWSEAGDVAGSEAGQSASSKGAVSKTVPYKMTNMPYFKNKFGDSREMRKQQKRQAEEIIHLLAQVHEGIKKAINTGRYEEAMGFLAQCQESAIQLGEEIEEVEGKNFKTIPLLEGYCERVFEIYDALGQRQAVNGGKAGKALRKALIPIENSVKNDIKIRTEVVFLPYKASMWDSLESVWRAADEDPDCDAYVIPIPYYTKNPDGSFREEHYEGDLYPDDVPVIWYENYDFAGRQPDVIFIHNPYDECNHVTSIHPFFYSKNLKQFTEKLVYIPYFILGEIDPEDKEAVEEMAHFCTVPGVIHADKVIVQSEKMRQVYVNVMTEYTKGTSADRKYWEKKILGLGSPKVDKVLGTRKEDVNVPEEWRKIIEKPDGSWKKIILYNTSVAALLQNSERMLAKMRYVFGVFKENADDVALLWRPHPLIWATIEAMRPQLWEEYEQIVKEYCEAGWGIYDDTPEMDRAIVLCDGYYGDHSSLVKLCQKVGKRCMIQSLGRRAFLETILDSGSFFWAIVGEANGSTLFQIDKKKWKAKYVGVPDENDVVQRKYEKILEYREKLYFIPRASDYLDVYDPQKNIWNRHYIEKPETMMSLPYESHVKFSFAFPLEDNIYFFPHTYPTIIKFNILSQKIDYLYECMNLFQHEKNDKPANFSLKGFSDGRYVTFYSCAINKILRFDMKLEKFDIMEEFLEGSYNIFEYDLENYWLLSTNNSNRIVKWNIGKKQVMISDTLKDFMVNRVAFQFSIIANGYLWMFPGLANVALKMDLHSNEMKIASEFTPGYICPDKLSEQWKFQCVEKTSHTLWAFDGTDGQFVKVDLKKGYAIRKPIIEDLKGTTKKEYSELLNDIKNEEFIEKNKLQVIKVGKTLFYAIYK